MAFVSDTFTAADSTALESHVGETGATWTEHPSLTAGSHLISANRARCQTSPAGHFASGTSANADYDVEGVFFVVTVSGESIGIAGRMSTSADDCYVVRYQTSSTRWELCKVVGGTYTVLGSFTATLTISTSYTAKLEMRGTALKVYIDGTERISVTDSTHSAAGRVGVRSAGTQSATARYHLESITGTDAAAAGPAGTMSVSAVGTVAAQGTKSVAGGSIASVTGGMTATGTKEAIGTAAATAAGTVVFVGVGGIPAPQGEAAITGGGAFAAAARKQATATLGVSGGGLFATSSASGGEPMGRIEGATAMSGLIGGAGG